MKIKNNYKCECGNSLFEIESASLILVCSVCKQTYEIYIDKKYFHFHQTFNNVKYRNNESGISEHIFIEADNFYHALYIKNNICDDFNSNHTKYFYEEPDNKLDYVYNYQEGKNGFKELPNINEDYCVHYLNKEIKLYTLNKE